MELSHGWPPFQTKVHTPWWTLPIITPLPHLLAWSWLALKLDILINGMSRSLLKTRGHKQNTEESSHYTDSLLYNPMRREFKADTVLSTVVAPLCIPTKMEQGSPCCPILPNTCLGGGVCLDKSQPDRCEGSPWAWFAFPDDDWVSFHIAVAHVGILLREMSIPVISPFGDFSELKKKKHSCMIQKSRFWLFIQNNWNPDQREILALLCSRSMIHNGEETT